MMPANSSSLTSRLGVRLVRPAQLMRMSTLPIALMTSSCSFWSEARLLTSQVARRVLRPRPSMALAVALDLGLAARAGHHVRARLAQSLDQGAADAGRSADDHRDTSRKVQRFERHGTFHRRRRGVLASENVAGQARGPPARRQHASAKRSPGHPGAMRGVLV